MSLRKNVVSVFGINLLGKIFNAATLVLIIRLYGNDLLGYASYTNAHAVFSFTVGFVFTAFNIGMVRYGGEYLLNQGKAPIHLYRAYLALQLIALGVLALGVLLLPSAISSLLFGSAAYVVALRYGLVAGSGYLLSNWLLHVLQTEERFDWYNHLNFWRQTLLLPGVALLYVLPDPGLPEVMGVFFLANLLPAVVISVWLRLGSLLTVWQAPGSQLWVALQQVRLLVVFLSLQTVFDQLGVFMLGHFGTPEEVARFGVLFRYYGAAMLLVVSLNAILLPRFTQVLLGDVQGQRGFFLQWMKWTLPGLLPVSIVLFLSKPVWVALNTEAYADLHEAAVYLGYGVYFSLICLPAFSALVARERYDRLLLYQVLGMTGFAVGAVSLLPTQGAKGAAILTTLFANGVFYAGMAFDAFVLPHRYTIQTRA